MNKKKVRSLGRTESPESSVSELETDPDTLAPIGEYDDESPIEPGQENPYDDYLGTSMPVSAEEFKLLRQVNLNNYLAATSFESSQNQKISANRPVESNNANPYSKQRLAFESATEYELDEWEAEREVARQEYFAVAR